MTRSSDVKVTKSNGQVEMRGPYGAYIRKSVPAQLRDLRDRGHCRYCGKKASLEHSASAHMALREDMAAFDRAIEADE